MNRSMSDRAEVRIALTLISDGNWYEIHYDAPDCEDYRLIFNKRIDDPADVAQRVGEEIMSWIYYQEAASTENVRKGAKNK